MTWLRMSGIPYETRTGTHVEMPYKKLPVRSQLRETQCAWLATAAVARGGATVLGAKSFLLSEQPSTIDATAFAFLHAEIRYPFESKIHDHVMNQPALVAYHDRIWDRYWSHPSSES